MGLSYPSQRCWRVIKVLAKEMKGHSCVFITGFNCGKAAEQGLIVQSELEGSEEGSEEGEEGEQGWEEAEEGSDEGEGGKREAEGSKGKQEAEGSKGREVLVMTADSD